MNKSIVTIMVIIRRSCVLKLVGQDCSSYLKIFPSCSEIDDVVRA